MSKVRSLTQRAQSLGLTVILSGLSVGMAAGAPVFWIEGPRPVAILLGAMSILMAFVARTFRWFEVTVSEEGLTYRWAGFRPRTVPLADIESVEVVKYPWLYGYGWRFVGRTVAYSMPFARRALAVGLRRGSFNRYLFTLPACEEAREVLAGPLSSRAPERS